MDLPSLVAFFVDGRDFHLEHEAHRRAAGRRQGAHQRGLDFRREAIEAGLGRHQLRFELRRPGRMGEVAGGHDRDALAGRPMGEMLKIEVAARRAGVFRVDVQVRVEPHGAPPRADSCAGILRRAGARASGTARRRKELWGLIVGWVRREAP